MIHPLVEFLAVQLFVYGLAVKITEQLPVGFELRSFSSIPISCVSATWQGCSLERL